MMMLIAIIIIIILICLDKDEYQKQKELDNQIVGYNTMNGRPILRKYVNITGYNTRTGQPIFEYKKTIIGYNPSTGEPIFEGDKIPEPIKTKQPLTNEDKTKLSNSILIITGAVLVVIASIIFLATGWETMHGLLKTLILLGIQFIFCFFGHVSNEKLNIPKIGKMFNYLTLAFVPIVLLSLSFFELVGEFFSIGGEGFNYFIGLSLIVSDIVYKLYGKLKQNIFTKQCSFIVEVLAILFIVSNIELMYIEAFALILHTIITYLLLQGGYLDDLAYGELNKVYSIVLIAVAGIQTISEVNIMSFTNLILLALNCFIKCINDSDKASKKSQLICFFISYLLAIRIIERVEISPYFLYLLSLLPILGLTKVVTTENMKRNIVRVVGILTVVTTITSLYNPEQSIYFLLTFIISFILSVLIYVLQKQSFYKLWAYISFSTIFFCICYITEIEGITEYILLVMPILVYAFEVIYDRLKDNLSRAFIIICLCIESLIFVTENILLIPLILLVIYLFLENKKGLLLIPMIESVLIFSLDNRIIVKAILGILLIIYLFSSIKKEKFNRYTTFSLITLVFMCLELEVSAYITWILICIWGIIHYFCKPKENNGVYLSTIILSLSGVYMTLLIDLDSELYANYALGIIVASIAMTKGVLKGFDKTFAAIIEWIVIIGLTLLGALIIEEAIDGVIYLVVLLILSILAYTKEWKSYLYSGVISIILGVIMLTAEYWREIPWYVYILFIGLALISFAMFDEKRKQAKKQQQVSQSINLTQPVIPDQPVLEEPTIASEEPISAQPVSEEPIVEEIPVVEEPTTVVEEKAEQPKITIQVVEDTSSTKELKKEQYNKVESKNNKKTNSSNKTKKSNNRR